MEALLASITDGKTTWPNPNMAASGVDFSKFGAAKKEDLDKFVKTFFRIMGTNCENIAVLTGYWDLNLPEKDLRERAEKIGRFWKE